MNTRTIHDVEMTLRHRVVYVSYTYVIRRYLLGDFVAKKIITTIGNIVKTRSKVIFE